MSDTNETGLAEVETETGLYEMPEDAGSGFQRMAKVSFFGSAAKEPRLTRLKEAGVKPGAFYLEDVAGIIAPDPFYFFVTPGLFRFYGKLDADGKKVLGLRGKVKGGWRPDRKVADDKGWEETTQALVLVPLGDTGIIPALIRTHKAVDRIWDPVEQTLAACKDPAVWAVRGPAQKVAAAAAYPFGRFLLGAYVQDEPIQGTKRTFAKGYSKVVPTPEKQVALFNEYVSSPAFKESLDVFGKIRAKLAELPATGV